MDDELRRLFETLRQDNVALRQENAAAHAETRRHFDVTAEGVRQEIRGVAEGVVNTRDLLSRETADIREEMRRGFAETQAMIKFSYTELDRRVSALEESRRTVEQTLADVQARLDRLESSTQ